MKGYIPIIDLYSFNNIFNSFKINTSAQNPWEIFFAQPYNYTIKEVLIKAKHLNYFRCRREPTTPHFFDFFKRTKIDFWHSIAKKYIPINNDIIKESNYVMKDLFRGSKNILGVLTRGTDYLALRPRGHPIIPNYRVIIKDINEMDKKNNYDFIFLATEDDIIRSKIIKEFKNKRKYFKYNKRIIYNYREKKIENSLAFHENIKGNINFMKIYLINLIILSKCIDIITVRTNGSIGIFIFTNGFRNTLIYSLGRYP